MGKQIARILAALPMLGLALLISLAVVTLPAAVSIPHQWLQGAENASDEGLDEGDDDNEADAADESSVDADDKKIDSGAEDSTENEFNGSEAGGSQDDSDNDVATEIPESGALPEFTDENRVKWTVVYTPEQFVRAMLRDDIANVRLGADIEIPGSSGNSEYNSNLKKVKITSTIPVRVKNRGEMIIDGRDPQTGKPHRLSFLGNHRRGLGNLRAVDSERPRKLTLRHLIAEGRDELGLVHAHGTKARPLTVVFDNCKLTVSAAADMCGYDSTLIIKDCDIDLAYRVGEGSSKKDAARNAREWSRRGEYKTIKSSAFGGAEYPHAAEAGKARQITLQGAVKIWKADSPAPRETAAIWYFWYGGTKYPGGLTVEPNAKVYVYDYSESPVSKPKHSAQGGKPTGLFGVSPIAKPRVKIGKSAHFEYRHLAGKDGRHGNGVLVKARWNTGNRHLKSLVIDDGATVIFDVMASRGGKLHGWRRNDGAYLDIRAFPPNKSDAEDVKNTGLLRIGERATFIFTLDYALANKAGKTRKENKLFKTAKLEIAAGANVVFAAKNNDGVTEDKKKSRGTAQLFAIDSLKAGLRPAAHGLYINNPENLLLTNGTVGAAIGKKGHRDMPVEIRGAGMSLWLNHIPQGLVFNAEDARWEIDENHPASAVFGKDLTGKVRPPSPINYAPAKITKKDGTIAYLGGNAEHHQIFLTGRSANSVDAFSTLWIGARNAPYTVTIKYFKGQKIKNPAHDIVILKVRSTERYTYQLVNSLNDGEQKYDLDIAGIKGALPACDQKGTASNCITIDRDQGLVIINKPQQDVEQNIFSTPVNTNPVVNLQFYKFNRAADSWEKDAKTAQIPLTGASGAKSGDYQVPRNLFAGYEFDYLRTIEENHGNAVEYSHAGEITTLHFEETTRSPVKLYFAAAE